MEGQRYNEFKPMLRDIYQKLIIVEKLIKEKPMSLDLKSALGGIKKTVISIEEKANQLPTAEQVAETSPSKITPTLNQLTSLITTANRSIAQATTGVENNCETILGHMASTSTDLNTKLKEYMDTMFENLQKFIHVALTESSKDISSEITSLIDELKSFKEQLKIFLKDDMPELLEKALEYIDVIAKLFYLQLKSQ